MTNLQKAITVILSFVGVVILVFAVAVWVAKSYNKWKSFKWFINGDQKFTIRALLLGTVSAIVFGFVDNAGMFFGIDALKPYLPGGQLTQAGFGNTISSVLGSFIAAGVGKIVNVTTGFQNGPVYADAIGMFIGGMLGTYIPAAITGKE